MQTGDDVMGVGKRLQHQEWQQHDLAIRAPPFDNWSHYLCESPAG